MRGPASFIVFMAAVSLNLFIVNLLPVPILDGGGILMLLIEMKPCGATFDLEGLAKL